MSHAHPHVRSDDARDRSSDRVERGFTLIELAVVMLIIMILLAIVFFAIRAAQTSARMSAMQAAGASVARGIDDFDRIYPRVGGTDELLTRAPGLVWSSNSDAAGSGLTDETGTRLVKEWPTDPYGPGGVRVYRSGPVGAGACSRPGARPGDIQVCRTAGVRGSIQVVAYARDRNNAVVEAYRREI